MLRNIIPVAILATALLVSAASAQGRQPAELPPAGFAGQQYVDSRGCVFARAGLGGQTNWVARLDRSRKQICGQTPSRTVMAAAQASLNSPEADVAQPFAARRQGASVPHVPLPAQLSESVGVPAARTAPSAASNLVERNRACPVDNPYGRFYRLEDGRNMLLCGSAPNKLRNLSQAELRRYSAKAAAPAPVAPVAKAPVAPRPAAPPAVAAPVRATSNLMTPPPGYKAAWSDGRLNPARAQGTSVGAQQMGQIWDEGAPQKMRQAPPAPAAVAPPQPSRRAAVGNGRFVQVGSFSVAQNASRAAARLQSAGLPVQIVNGQIRGKPVQVVRAGPFASTAEARVALGTVRSVGFPDAVVRN